MNPPLRTYFILACLALSACTAHNPDLAHHDLGAGGDLALASDLSGGDFSGFATAPHRNFPSLARASSGGILSPMRLVVITAAGDSSGDDLATFGDAAVKSRWFSTVTAEYGVAAPSGSVHLVGAAFAAGTAPLGATQVSTYVQQTLAATTNPPAPDGKTLYLVYLPTGVDLIGNVGCKIPWGYHHAYGTGGDGFAVVQRCQGGYETMMQALTIVGSHEIAEAATDTGLGWRVAIPSSTTPPWMADPWLAYESSRVTENGDLCIDSRILEDGNYYQRAFSDAAAQAGGDPCVPSLPMPYYGATTERPWYSASAGTTLTIPVTGWSTAPTENWIVRARVQNSSDATLAWTAATGGTTLNNGMGATLTVGVPATAPSGAWVAIYLLAERQDANKHPLPGDDYAHLQMVGVWVP